MEGMVMWKEFISVVGTMLHKQHFVPGKGLCVLRKISEYREYRVEDRLRLWDRKSRLWLYVHTHTHTHRGRAVVVGMQKTIVVTT